MGSRERVTRRLSKGYKGKQCLAQRNPRCNTPGLAVFRNSRALTFVVDVDCR